MIDIVVIRSNSIINNPRVRKIVGSLMKRYSIVTLGWNRDGISKKLIKEFDVKLYLHNIKAPIGNPTVVFYLPLFWIWTFFKLIKINPKIIHACDLDTVIPCYIYKVLFRKYLIFDVCDRYAMSKISPKNKILYSMVNSLEEKLALKADTLVTVSEKLLNTFEKKPNKTQIIMNCPKKIEMNNQKLDNKKLKLVYTGNVTSSRGLQNIVNTIKDLSEVEFHFAGRIIEKKLHNEIIKIPNVKYHGILKLSDALLLEANSDVMIILYDLKIPINNFAMPNKIFEAMMFGLPIITNIATDIINEVKCGFNVKYNDINEIKSIIIRLSDNLELRKKLGDNGEKAFDEKYNWGFVEQKLFQTYGYYLKNEDLNEK